MPATERTVVFVSPGYSTSEPTRVGAEDRGPPGRDEIVHIRVEIYVLSVSLFPSRVLVGKEILEHVERKDRELDAGVDDEGRAVRSRARAPR